MKKEESLKLVQKHLQNRNLGEAIQTLEIFLSVHPHQINSDRLYAVQSDYKLMTDYWRHGFKDPQLPGLYDNLLQRMYVLFANIAINYSVRHSHYMSSLFLKAHMTPRDWSPSVIREEMESFVSDVAMADLEPEHVAKVKKKETYARHYESMVVLCDYILTTGLWTDGFASSMEEMLLSPTIDGIDQQLLVSCVTLSAINQFDIAKFRMLMHVYQQSTDEQVRQRALVGWTFALDDQMAQIYPEEVRLVQKLIEDDRVCRELLELQHLIIFCINAEADRATIQQEIMPNLMKGQRLHMRNGLMEVDEDSLNDILHPDETEKDIEKMEASFQKMIDMQKQGSDIYYGGFAQMKRFPFFGELANWLIPFTLDHPSITSVIEQFKGNRFLMSLTKTGPFCNSDKYSFLLAFSHVVSSVSQQVLEMMERGEATVNDELAEDSRQPSFIRRSYLQDLYRFFRLFPQRDCFRNIFDTEGMAYLFFSNRIFSGTHLEAYFNDMTAFLIKRKKTEEAKAMIRNYGEYRRDIQYYLMAAYLGVNSEINYSSALKLEPNNERALMGLARELFSSKRYEQALGLYDRLLALNPEKKSHQLNRSVCLTKLGRYDEAEKVLFKLNYEKPDDLNVSRVLSWALTCNGKYEQAENLYKQLLSVEEPSADDLLNYGYCLWFSGHVDDAADCFHRYLKMTGLGKEHILKDEVELITAMGITEPEMQMMLYIL